MASATLSSNPVDPEIDRDIALGPSNGAPAASEDCKGLFFPFPDMVAIFCSIHCFERLFAFGGASIRRLSGTSPAG